MVETIPVSEEQLNQIYNWVDSIPLSRPKRNITRDFSDGVLMAEIVAYFAPNIVEIHNYSAANSSKMKQYNWSTLNNKVFKRFLKFTLAQQDIDNVVNCIPEAVERILIILQIKLEDYLKKNQSDKKDGLQQEQGSIQQQEKQMGGTNDNAGSDNVLWMKDQTISELRETIEILELKIKKMEALIKLKDNKIQNLANKLSNHGLL